MKQTLSILFYLKKAKTDNNGLAPIYLRLTVDGKRAEISVHRSIEPAKWNASGQCAKGNKEDSRNLNEYLDQVKNKVYKHSNMMSSNGSTITAETLKNSFLEIATNRHTLVEVFQYHNKQMWAKVGIDFAPGTAKRFDITLRKIQSFLQHHFSRSDIALSELNHQFISEFEFYLKTHDNCEHNTTMKYLKNLKKVVSMALANEWLEKNPFLSFKCTSKETNRGYLTQEELNMIVEKSFSMQRLEIVRDIFLFSCYTGLSYSDVEKLKPSDIITGIDGKKWITIFREKTEGRSSIPLLPTALEVIEKYKNFPENVCEGKLLPVKSNQKLNAYLKEIGDICGIRKNMSFHLARHTFATTVTLTNGVPIETVSSMLGHRSIRTTQIYSKVVDSKISSDMHSLELKLTKRESNEQLTKTA